MHMELTPDHEAFLKEQVRKGRFASLDEAFREALHQGMNNIVMDHEANDVDEEWLAYADERISRGLEDVAAGRVIPAEQVMAELNSRRTKQA